MRVASYIVVLSAILAGCSARSNNFGDLPDSGDAGIDVAQPDMDDMDEQPAKIGELCAGPADCVSEGLCIGDTAGDFQCMARCSVPYDLCGDGAVCLPVMTQDASICYIGGAAPITDVCANNLSCEPGLLCFGASGEFYCRPACGDTSDTCEPGEYCLRLDSGAGLCRSLVGSACQTSADCSGLSCSVEIAEIGGVFPAGYCTSVCTVDGDCPGNTVCRTVPQTTQSVCMQQCSHRSECRFNADYDCLDGSICDGSSDPDACRSMFGEESLCVPGAL